MNLIETIDAEIAKLKAMKSAYLGHSPVKVASYAPKPLAKPAKKTRAASPDRSAKMKAAWERRKAAAAAEHAAETIVAPSTPIVEHNPDPAPAVSTTTRSKPSRVVQPQLDPALAGLVPAK